MTLIRIPFETGVFETPNHKYYVQPLEMHYRRNVLFKKWKTKVLYGVTNAESIEFIRSLYFEMKNAKGDSLMASWMDTFSKVEKYHDSIKGKKKGEELELSEYDCLKFSTLYVTREGEDLSTWDERYSH